MKKFSLTYIILCISMILTSCGTQKESSNGKTLKTRIEDNIFCFYYNWYGNTEHNGHEIHWAHGVIKQNPSDPDQPGFPGGDNIGANFYPQLKNYSCTDPEIIAQHMKMIAKARIGVISVTWWNDNDFGVEAIPTIMDEAQKAGVKVCFHLEPYPGRSPETVKNDIKILLDTYGNHPAFYRMDGKPLFFVYDSYLISAADWAKLLTPEGSITIRNTSLDAIMIGLWVKQGEESYFETSGFDGMYTYFAATGFTYGSTPGNWKYIQKWADDHGKIFIPSVGPGYIDTRIRPWNGGTARDREGGKYYDRMFKAAIDCGAQYISITSFNEWHEGTQIEPAITFSIPDFTYLDYAPEAPDFYLKKTANLVGEFEKSLKEKAAK